MRPRLRAAVLAAAAAFVVAVFSEAAGAGIPSPDASIAKRRTGTYVGGDVYGDECPQADQSVTKTVARGEKKSLWVRIENEGGGGRLAFVGEKSPVGMTFRYFRGSENITNRALPPGPLYDFHVGAGDSIRIRWQVKARSDAPLGTFDGFCSLGGNESVSIQDVVAVTLTIVE